MALGIAAYNAYFPEHRLPARALKGAWGSAPQGLVAKPVAGPDEDALTLAIAAAAGVAPGQADALALASMSLPYRRKAQAGFVAVALGLGPSLVTTEHTTSARAGSEALLAQLALLHLRGGGTGVVVAAETATGPARGGADAAVGAGAVALLLAEGGEVATVEGFSGHVAEDPGLQFARAEEMILRDVEVPDYAATAYAVAVIGAVRPLLHQLGRQVADYRFLVLNPPDPRLMRTAARALRAGAEQWQAAWTFAETGDLGSAQPLAGLAAAFDAAQPGDRILVVAYGSGSAADAISLVAGPACGRGVLRRALDGGAEIDYVTYLKLRGEI